LPVTQLTKEVLVILKGRRCAALAATLIASACATTSPLLRQECYNADAQLAKLLQPLEALRAKGCDAGIAQRGTSECDGLRRELERLAVICPGHAPTLMANAVIAYDEHRPAKSQQFLDEILAQSRSYPDAAVLRARIAVEEGNLPFARRLLAQQIKVVPDHAGLHETYAAILYLERQLPEARRELTTAGALGAPRWRVAYHLGLIEEASGRLDEALRYYSEALDGNPEWAPAQSRLNGLRARTPPRS
jgi:tetratricopeptide (TPR) repeat protein